MYTSYNRRIKKILIEMNMIGFNKFETIQNFGKKLRKKINKELSRTCRRERNNVYAY